SGVEQTLEINFVRVFFQKKNVLAHDESPDGVIDGRVIVVTLIDCELEQMFGATGDCRVVIADTVLRIHSGRPLRWVNISYDSTQSSASLQLANQGMTASQPSRPSTAHALPSARTYHAFRNPDNHEDCNHPRCEKGDCHADHAQAPHNCAGALRQGAAQRGEQAGLLRNDIALAVN